MTIFIRSISAIDKKSSLDQATTAYRNGGMAENMFILDSSNFSELPGSPFAYWASQNIRDGFARYDQFESKERAVKQGLATADDFRFVRLHWETPVDMDGWIPYAKGGSSKPFYQEIYCLVRWADGGSEIKNNLNERGTVRSNVWMLGETERNFFLKKGITWPLRGYRFSSQAVPDGCIFSVAGKMAFPENQMELSTLALFNSRAFDSFVMMLAGRVVGAQYEVGLIQKVPYPEIPIDVKETLVDLARLGWKSRYRESSVDETTKAFLLPNILYSRLETSNSSTESDELQYVLEKIDDIAFELYGFSEADRAAFTEVGVPVELEQESNDDEGEQLEIAVDPQTHVLSWAVGVSFGRFDLRLATGVRIASPEPDPFDPLPINCPGMLPIGDQPFHVYPGILVESKGHPHDLPRLVEEVLELVKVAVPDNVRRWLQRDFFAFHFQRYSKSRRKAPIYWPLSTNSGSFTLWVYYPSLSSQTLYSAINDFVEPKLKHVGADITGLRNKGAARSREDEKQFEALQAFELELVDLRDTLLKLAPTYEPNHDDGVQITAAPLWTLFRHKPWQKVLKDTWVKLEKGDYDWAHLAMNYWPDRVREKCKTDKSLAIAHGLENLYVELEAKPKKARSKK